MIEQDTPLPDATGFSLSCAIELAALFPTAPILFLPVPALILFLPAAPWAFSTNGGPDIVKLSKPLPATDRLEYMVMGFDAAAYTGVTDRVVSGLIDLVELTAEDAAVEELKENGEKTDPSTRFAFSREASFLRSNRKREGFFASGEGGRGRRSNGTKPAGRRVIRIERGRCRLG